MNDFRLLIAIVRRDQGKAYREFLVHSGAKRVMASLCNGTASKSMLDYLGIEKTEKLMLKTMLSARTARRLQRQLIEVMGIDVPGNGISMTIPVGSIGGVSSMQYLVSGQEIEQEEVKKVSEYPYALIITIADKGNVDIIMDAARSAGARGGTVIAARGTGAEMQARFFGISIGEEKEIVYIVAKKAEKAAIMQAIMAEAGPNSEAHGVLFSLPVDSIAGLRSVAEHEEEA